MCKKVVSKFGYGEDSFTFIALNDRLDEILEKLGDKSDPEVFFYRPSLGRGLNVGEFDGIISTKNAIFLIEAKWMNRCRLSKKRPGIFSENFTRNRVQLKSIFEKSSEACCFFFSRPLDRIPPGLFLDAGFPPGTSASPVCLHIFSRHYHFCGNHSFISHVSFHA